MGPRRRECSGHREAAVTAGDGNDKGTRVQAMFARIAPRYDLMNALMTGGRDRA